MIDSTGVHRALSATGTLIRTLAVASCLATLCAPSAAQAQTSAGNSKKTERPPARTAAPAQPTKPSARSPAPAPAPAVALAMADVMRRPGVRALALDQARILAPLGTISDDRERATILADLRDDLLVPLGSVVLPGGLRGGGVAGSLGIAAPGGAVEIDLLAGGLELVDLAPGETAVLELRFREAVDLGAHARHFAVEVVGGLAGLIVDLRGVPLRLPDRAEPRRELLAGWQSVLWEDAGR